MKKLVLILALLIIGNLAQAAHWKKIFDNYYIDTLSVRLGYQYDIYYWAKIIVDQEYLKEHEDDMYEMIYPETALPKHIDYILMQVGMPCKSYGNGIVSFYDMMLYSKEVDEPDNELPFKLKYGTEVGSLEYFLKTKNLSKNYVPKFKIYPDSNMSIYQETICNMYREQLRKKATPMY